MTAPTRSARPELTPLDTLLAAAEAALRTLSGATTSTRPSPAAQIVGDALTAQDKRLSGALMRVNHVGEVCAQALYQAQALGTRDAALKSKLLLAAQEETDHLGWTQQRLDELGAHPSWLNPLWYAGSFGIGWVAARAGDSVSLGFVVETERQVERHLDHHLNALPVADAASRAIVTQMKADEARHARDAEALGAQALPAPIRWLMRAASKVMTTTAHRI
jgi:3-demethoxyubiquinol 3-hydroxylase